MRLIYRRATLTDLEALLALERDFPGDRLSRRAFRHLLTQGNAQVWVCTHAQRVLANAVVLYRANTRSARLYSIIVAANARGRGIAKALVETIEAAARRHGCKRIGLEVRTDNGAAIALYDKLGYRRVRRIAAFYEDGRDALRLERDLQTTSYRTTTRSLAA